MFGDPKDLIEAKEEVNRLAGLAQLAGLDPESGVSLKVKVAREKAAHEEADASARAAEDTARAAKDAEKASAEKVTRSGTVFRCKPGAGVAILLIKSEPSFEAVYRPGDFPVIAGFPAATPCVLEGKNVTVTTFACDQLEPCIAAIEVHDGY